MTSIRLPLVAALLLIPGLTASAQNAPKLGKAPLKDVVAAMTTEEKAKLLVGMGWSFRPGVTPAPEDAVPEKVPGAAGRTHAIPRLGIPSLTLSDGPAGVRINSIRNGDSTKTYYATAFPMATLLAATWDTALVRGVGNAFGEEVREYGVDVLLAPAMNIHRNPLGGRNFEYYSEDPVVSGHISAAMVRGLQAEGVGTSVKHYVGNNQEFNRTKLNTILSERALQEIYLKGFRIAVQEGQPWTVMSSYNLINGTYTSESRGLLTTVLRDEWGFQGFVMTDWGGGSDPVAQMKAGNDLIEPGNPGQTNAIVEAVKNGTLSQQQLDQNVERVLRIVLMSPSFKQYKYSNAPDLKAHAQVSRNAATQGMVLLKNDGGTLPLAAARKVALFGNSSYQLIAGGLGSGDVHKAYTVSLDRGLAHAGYTVNAALKDAYARYMAEQKAKQPPPAGFRPPPPIPEMAVDASVIRREAGEADVAMISIGRISGEGTDRTVEGDFTLNDTERALIRDVADAFHAAGKKVVVVMNVAGVTEVASWRDHADAILLAWLPGQEGGNAIADVLSGTVNPSGKLASTFPVSYGDVPSAGNFPGKEIPGQGQAENQPGRAVPSEVTYDEGIYVGYRYYQSFGVKPAYEFGYGLSYTSFDYSGLKLSSSRFDGSITATVTVKNSGTVPGREVAEVYLSAPGKTMDKPQSELKAFAKTNLLRPGQSQVLTFTLTGADLASYDTARSAWVAEAGAYTVKAGASSLDIRQQATFDLPKELVVEQAQNVLMPQVEIHERTPVPGASVRMNGSRVTTAGGVVQGTTLASGIHVFRGIPYAAPPVRDLRWKPPQPPAGWQGVRPADRFAAQCMQTRVFGDMMFRNSGVSEDCLYLNVWTAEVSKTAKRPVLVYFYGGGFVAGDGSEPRYDGESLAQKGVVAVTISYRLGVFGFFAHPELTAESPHHASGNYALMDQTQALRWVQENIAAFGGDPSQVTIGGESAGSISVSAQVASPLAKGLFVRGIGESGSVLGAFAPVPLAEAEQQGVAFAKGAGAASLADLRAIPALQLLEAAARPGALRSTLAVDGYFFPKPPSEIYAAGEQAHVPLLVGWNSEEMSYRFLLGPNDATPESFKAVVERLYGDHAGEVLKVYPASTKEEAVASATALASDRFIAYSTWKWAEMQRLTGHAPVYRYFYAHPRPPMRPEMGNATAGLAGGVVRGGTDQPPAPPPTGAVHSAEIEYALGNLATNPVYAWTDEDYAVSRFMEGYFANFIQTGDPNGPGLPEWPAVGGGKDGAETFMRIAVTPRAQTSTVRDRYLLLDRLNK